MRPRLVDVAETCGAMIDSFLPVDKRADQNIRCSFPAPSGQFHLGSPCELYAFLATFGQGSAGDANSKLRSHSAADRCGNPRGYRFTFGHDVRIAYLELAHFKSGGRRGADEHLSVPAAPRECGASAVWSGADRDYEVRRRRRQRAKVRGQVCPTASPVAAAPVVARLDENQRLDASGHPSRNSGVRFSATSAQNSSSNSTGVARPADCLRSMTCHNCRRTGCVGSGTALLVSKYLSFAPEPRSGLSTVDEPSVAHSHRQVRSAGHDGLLELMSKLDGRD